MDEDGTAKVQESSVQSPGALIGIPIFNEASDIYEVEKIIAGPHRRREHLNKMCYKVRWKGYGPEEDTWQPKADLIYVQDLIDEYTKDKTLQIKLKKRKMVEEVGAKENGPETKKPSPAPVIVEEGAVGDSDSEAIYHPDYGYMKDTFWKDLELGRVRLEGDMYSKIKGSRRAAHAEAMANLQKQNQPQPQSKTNNPKSAKKLVKSASKTNLIKTSLSNPPSPTKSASGKVTKAAVKNKKRNPFGARGYMTPKKKKAKGGKMVASVTSETVSEETWCMVGTDSNPSSPVAPTPPPEEGASDLCETPSIASTDASFEEDSSLHTEDLEAPTENIQQPLSTQDENKTIIDPTFHQTYSSIPDSTSDNKEDFHRSTLDGIAEAKMSVERTHEEQCLWGGACNRQDCKANRRWNNKNGKDQLPDKEKSKCEKSSSSGGDKSSTSSGDKFSTSSESNAHIYSTSSDGSNKTSSTLSSCSSERRLSSSSIPEIPRMDKESTSSGSDRRKSSASYHQNVFSPSPMKQSPPCPPDHIQNPFSNRSYSSDSSFEEGISPALTRDSVSDTFSHKGASSSANKFHTDTVSIPHSSSSSTSHKPNTSNRNNSSRPSGSERPGLFSDSFSLLISDTTASGSKNSPHMSGVSSHHSSPGKENTAHTDSASFPAPAPSSSLRTERHADFPSQDLVSSSSSSHTAPPYVSSSAIPPVHKRVGEAVQPLEKIPSPNSRRGMDLDKRISTLTCDELEDFPEQGDDCSKGTMFVTNADLLQAVNLSKGEVVKRGVQQASLGSQRLDLEQADTTGLSLLMKAVHKGNLAIAEMLLEHGAIVNSQQASGVTALMMAAEQNNVCMVTLLLKHGANSSLYTVTADVAETALMKAIRRQHREVVNLMLRVGVNIAAPTCSGMSALELAVDRRNQHIEALVRGHMDRLTKAFESRVLATLEDTAQLMEQLFPLQCFPLREAAHFTVKFNSHIQPVPSGEGFLLFIAHTKINDKGVRCRFHGSCPIASVSLNGIEQSPLTKEVNFVTSCHPIIPGCNTLVITKQKDYTSKAKLLVCAYRAKLIC